MSDSVSRRSIIGGSAGAMALAAGSAPAAAKSRLDLQDPLQRARTRAKLIGSAGEETVYILFRLNLYAYLNDGGLVPLMTMNNLSVTRWKPLPNGNYLGSTGECGVYCRFDTDEVLEVWENPITHEKRPVWEFLGGPFNAEIGPDGIVTHGAELQPAVLRMEILGDMVFVQTAAGFSAPNPLKPRDWPTQSSGPMRYWDSQATYGAKVSDAADPDILSAPTFCQFQNLGTWHPWLGMGPRPGRTYGKAYGAKLKGVDDIPKAVRIGFEKKTPEIFSFDTWTAPHLELKEYMDAHTPS